MSVIGSAIALYARETEAFDARVAQALARLRRAAGEYPGRSVQATSLGAEDMVITDLIAGDRLGIAVGTLETGLLHAETRELVARLESRYGLGVEVYTPVKASVVRFSEAHGERAIFESIESRKACCAIRKLEPLSRLLQGRDAWITGMRREQSANRAAVEFRELDDGGRSKFNPLADWSWAEVWHYIATNDVPYNPMHDRFHPSIGCVPCTRAIAVGEDFRSGRWWWEQDDVKECGLHAKDPPIHRLSPIGAHA